MHAANVRYCNSSKMLLSWVGVKTHLVGRIRSGVWVSASFQKNARFVGWSGSGPPM